jgi:hypothetical protein
MASSFPAFFDAVPAITLRDPLAEILGAAEGGLIEYRFADAVRLAGHSCPTVAGGALPVLRIGIAAHGYYSGAGLPPRVVKTTKALIGIQSPRECRKRGLTWENSAR